MQLQCQVVVWQRAHVLRLPAAQQLHPQQQQQHQQRRTHVTPAVYLVLWCSMTLGFMLGFSFATSTAITTAPPFLEHFFPEVLRALHDSDAAGSLQRLQRLSAGTHSRSERPLAAAWCAYASHSFAGVAWLVASRYYFATLSMLPAAWLTRRYGRRAGVWVSCVAFLLGSVLVAAASHMAQLFVGNLIVGVGVAFMFQSIYLEDAEIAPAALRGSFTACSVLASAVGYTCGSGLLWAAPIAHAPYGWRLAVGLGAWPAVVVLLLLPGLPETAASLIQRGRLVEGREALRRIRGPFIDIDTELMDIWEKAGRPKHQEGSVPPWQMLGSQLSHLRHARHWIPVLVCSLLSFLREASGLFVLQPITPVLLEAQFGADVQAGLWRGGALTNGAYVLGCVVGVCLADVVGRRALLVSGSLLATVCWAVLAAVLARHDSVASLQRATPALPALTTAMLVLVNASNGWGLQSMIAPVTSEAHALPTRAGGLAISIAVLLLVKALVAHVVDAGLCALQWRSLALVACGSLLAALVAAALLPEFKRLPLEHVDSAWQRHWLWGRVLARCAGKQLPRLEAAPPAVGAGARSISCSSGTGVGPELAVEASAMGVTSGPAAIADFPRFWRAQCPQYVK